MGVLGQRAPADRSLGSLPPIGPDSIRIPRGENVQGRREVRRVPFRRYPAPSDPATGGPSAGRGPRARCQVPYHPGRPRAGPWLEGRDHGGRAERSCNGLSYSINRSHRGVLGRGDRSTFVAEGPLSRDFLGRFAVVVALATLDLISPPIMGRAKV